MILSFTCVCIAAFARAARGDFISTDYDKYNDGELGHRPHLEFHSSDEFAPILQANIWDRDAISDKGSHIFVKHDGNKSAPLSSPLIIDSTDLSAVYMNRTFKNVFGTRVQENFGKKYLTFWEGNKGAGIGDGYGLAFDDTYRLAYKVWAQDLEVKSDLHEFAFTGNGTALVTGVDKLMAKRSDFTPEWEVPEEFEVLDSIFQEIDLETNEVLFNWRALEHVNPMDSFEPRASGWDAYHTNSIEKTQAGNYLISIRHVHSLFLIDGKTGDIIWTLGGKGNDFEELPPIDGLGNAQPVLSMGWQHHAHYVSGTNETQMTFFDNHVKITSHGECDNDCSRGLHIAINDTVSPPTVQLLREFRHPTGLQAQSQGSMQPLLPSPEDIGNVFIGWGRCPTFTEHNSTGQTVMDVQISPWHSPEIPDALDNYRAYKMDWSATPWWDPTIAPRKNSTGGLVVYVSWNGATEVAEWVVRGADTESPEDEAEMLTKSPRAGFETKLTIGETAWRYIWAEAVDIEGNVLRSSEVVDLNHTELSVASDIYEKTNSTFLPLIRERPHPEGWSTAALALIGTALGVTGLAILDACVIIWYRRRDYNRVKNADFDLDPDDAYHDGDVDGGDEDDKGAKLDPESIEDDDTRALLSKER
ncbi:hypothetical protein FQN54_002442 [Arachnomyces sp. PD_36]|nr:hypothetical protein FQN54_002442 [Arachnomyces sp. PD_36]